MAATTTPAAMASLQARIAARLASTNVFAQVRALIQEYTQGVDPQCEKDVLENLLSFVESQSLLRNNRVSGEHDGVPAANAQDVRKGGPGLLRVDESRLNLRVAVHKGKAFIAQLSESRARSEKRWFQLHLCLLGTRATSLPVDADVEPAFNQAFIFPLADLPQTPSDWTDLVTRGGALLQLCLTLNDPPLHPMGDGQPQPQPPCYRELVACASLDWRHVLTRQDQVFGLELQATGVDPVLQGTAGLLEVTLSLVPSPVPYASPVSVSELDGLLRADTTALTEARRHFYVYSRDFWADFTSISPLMANRPVKIFAADEGGQHHCVCSFVRPLRSGRLLETPRHAARFVSLIPLERLLTVGGARCEAWQQPLAFVARGRGDVEDHATLLCSLLLGFGLDAYVVLGTVRDKGSDAPTPHAWVMTRTSEGGGQYQRPARVVYFWESLSGQRFRMRPHGTTGAGGKRAVLHPKASRYYSIGCVFSDRRLLANKQEDERVASCVFDLEDEALWRPMDEARLQAALQDPSSPPHRPNPFGLVPGSLDPVAAAEFMEAELRMRVSKLRVELGLDTRWDEQLSHLLQPALVSYELERVSGAAGIYNDDFQASIRRFVPAGHAFKGYPTCFNHLDPARAGAALLDRSNQAAADVILARGDYARFALRVRVTVYPENMVSVWVMLAVRYQPVAATSSNQHGSGSRAAPHGQQHHMLHRSN